VTRPATPLTARWEQEVPGAASRVLDVVGGGYRGLLGAREWLYRRGLLQSRAIACPVVSVGNLTVGGTGKTPAVELAVQTLAALGRRPAIVSRGYGRRSGGVQVVADTASIRLDAEDAGDEPFLLARRLPGIPIVVGANRYRAALEAVRRFAVTAIVLDDGFQHRTLKKDLEIVMARAERPWGNGRLLPAGPLREPLGALGRADLVVAVGAKEAGKASEVLASLARHAPGVPVALAEHAPAECVEVRAAGRSTAEASGEMIGEVRAAGRSPAEASGEMIGEVRAAGRSPAEASGEMIEYMRRPAPGRLAGMRLLAFAGIASPRSFERTLVGLGASVAELVAFPDHHWYSRDELAALWHRAAASGADALVTTEKDWVRLRPFPPSGRPLFVLTVRLVLHAGEAEWRAAFERACARR